MKLIIDIDDSDYERIKDLVANDTRYTTATTLGTAYQVIASGLPYEERPHGEWKLDSLGAYCSECGTHPDCSSNYCPNCGASMQGGAEECI